MKERHIRLELAQTAADSESKPLTGVPAMRAVGWDMAARTAALGLNRGSLIDVAYRIRENDHPSFGGLEIEIAGMRPSEL